MVPCGSLIIRESVGFLKPEINDEKEIASEMGKGVYGVHSKIGHLLAV